MVVIRHVNINVSYGSGILTLTLSVVKIAFTNVLRSPNR